MRLSHVTLLLLASSPAAGLVTGVLLSLYPKVPEGASLKAAIHGSTKGLTTLGLATSADSVSSCLLGPEPTLFEAVRVVLGRAARLPDEPHVSMTCLFSSGDPALGPSFEPPPRMAGPKLDLPSVDADVVTPPVVRANAPPSKRQMIQSVARMLKQVPLRAAGALAQASGPRRAEQIARGIAQASDPARIAGKLLSKAEAAVAAAEAAEATVAAEVADAAGEVGSGVRPRRPDEAAWVAEATELPSRVACQFSVYVLGASDYDETRRRVAELVAASPAACADTGPAFCSMLEGGGEEVMGILRESFALARGAAGSGGHVVMQATLTANLPTWKREARG